MNSSGINKIIVIIFLLSVLCVVNSNINKWHTLYFPQFTVLQFTVGIALPIEVPERKVFLNAGLQVNYNLPFSIANFAHPTFWADRSLANEPKTQENQTRTKRDLSAGEMYKTLQEMFIM